MLATLLIVFREVIEAGLIVGIVLAATSGVPRRGRWVAGGVAGRHRSAPALWRSSPASSPDAVRGLRPGAVQRRHSARRRADARPGTTSGWRAMAARWRRECGPSAPRSPPARSLAALAIVVGVAVLREGSEVVLFLYGIAARKAGAIRGMLAGGAVVLAARRAVCRADLFRPDRHSRAPSVRRHRRR